MTEKEFAKRINSIGGRLFIVGGWVRDRLRGRQPKDKDYVVTGITGQAFQEEFADAGAKLIGKAFPVFLVAIDGVRCEVAFARKERKTGPGYKGFAVSSDADITIEEDLYRRDTTMNSIALELLPEDETTTGVNNMHDSMYENAPCSGLPCGRLIDPYGGQADIEAGVIRPVSEHFCEDPVRALRAARQAAQTGFVLSPEVILMMEKCREELKLEPGERILNEMRRALLTEKPSVFFRGLQEAGLLETIFPEVFALIGQTQPEAFHPEGDAFEHVMLVIDRIAAQYATAGADSLKEIMDIDKDRITAVFCGLAHDLGKGLTPKEELPHHYGHEETGGRVLDAWNQRVTLPSYWLKPARFIIANHMRAARMTKPGKILKFITEVYALKSDLSPFGVKAVIRADHGDNMPAYLAKMEELHAELMAISGRDVPEGVKGKKVGEWLSQKRCHFTSNWLNKNSQSLD